MKLKKEIKLVSEEDRRPGKMIKLTPDEKIIEFNSTSPADLIRQAVSGGADLEKLEKLLALQERWEANEAKKAYHKAMTAFKANPPDIEKDIKVAYLNVRYSHASLVNVAKKINEELSKHGLSASWKVKQNGAVSVTCKITHEQGHSEETTITAPADNTGSKNIIQSIGSTITYLERYTLLAATGLATRGMDDDGQTSGKVAFSVSDKGKIKKKAVEMEVLEQKKEEVL